MDLVKYQDWAAKAVNTPPAKMLSDWKFQWGETLKAIRGAKGHYEHTALIISRWEFLGGLYLGKSETKAIDAKSYADKFMPPAYAAVQNVASMKEDASDLFSMLRNKILHGYTPAPIGIVIDGKNDKIKEVMAWSIPDDPHLELSTDNNICISSEKLEAEFLGSLDKFATHMNNDTNGAKLVNWKRSFWGRYRPVDFPENLWIAEGTPRVLATKPRDHTRSRGFSPSVQASPRSLSTNVARGSHSPAGQPRHDRHGSVSRRFRPRTRRMLRVCRCRPQSLPLSWRVFRTVPPSRTKTSTTSTGSLRL